MDINYNFLYTNPLDYKILLEKIINCSCLYLKQKERKNNFTKKLTEQKPIFVPEYIDTNPLNIQLIKLISQYNNFVIKYVYLYNLIMTTLENIDKTSDICKLQSFSDLKPNFCTLKDIKINTTNKLIKEEKYDKNNIYSLDIRQKKKLVKKLFKQIKIYKKKIKELDDNINQLNLISLEDFKKELEQSK